MIYFLNGNRFIEFNQVTKSLTRNEPTSITQWADGCPQETVTNPIYENQWNNNGRRVDEATSRRNDYGWNNNGQTRFPSRTTTRPIQVHIAENQSNNNGRRVNEGTTIRNDYGWNNNAQTKFSSRTTTRQIQVHIGENQSNNNGRQSNEDVTRVYDDDRTNRNDKKIQSTNDAPTNSNQNQHQPDASHINAETLISNDSSTISTNNKILLLHMIIFFLWNKIN